jgi:hypothetical protein
MHALPVVTGFRPPLGGDSYDPRPEKEHMHVVKATFRPHRQPKGTKLLGSASHLSQALVSCPYEIMHSSYDLVSSLIDHRMKSPYH